MLGPGEESKGSGHYGAIVTPSFAFGLDIACKNCLWHIEGDRIMWSVGAQMVLYNTQSLEMRFIPLADRGARALVLAVASNCKYFAVAERVPGLEYDQISVYAFGQDKRVKVLPHDTSLSRAESSHVECLHFSENSKYLLAQYGTPDWTLVVWRWYNGKVLACHRMESRPVLAARFSPVDDLLLAVLTPTSLLLFRLDLDREGLNGLAAPQSWEAFRLTAMSWIAGNMLAVVGAGGEVNVFQEATTRLSTRVGPLPRAADEVEATVAAIRGGGGGGSGGGGAVDDAAAAGISEHLTAVAARGRGFITAGISGTVYFFEPPSVEQKRAGTRDLYVLVRRLALNLPPPPDIAPPGPGHHYFHRGHRTAAGGAGGGGGALAASLPPLPPGVDPAASGERPVVLLSVSGGDEEVIAVSAYGDISVASMQVVLEREEKPIAELVGPEMLEGEPFTRLLGGFMTGRVVGLAAAAAQPLIAAVSAEDRQLRVWNYDARRCVAALTLEDEPQGLDMHPGGQLVLLALPDKIKMYRVLLDALEQQFEVAMKRPTAVRFSTGGALFAYVGRTNAVHLHTTYHGQPQLAALKAHASAVNDLRFTADDRMLVSVGASGAVYFWDLASYSRVMDLELVDKQALYCSVAVYSSETGAAVVRASDGRMQQIYNGKVHYEVNCRGNMTSPSCLLGADKVLLAADDCGGVLSYVWPSEVPPRPGFAALAPPPHPYPLHSAVGGGITRLVLVPSRGLLFSANSDGAVIMSSIALVLDGVLLEASPAGVGMHPRARLSTTTSRILGSAASQKLLAGGAGDGGGGGGSAVSPSLPYYITIPEERLLAVRERAIEVAMLVGNAKNDAEYQAFRAGQVLRDTITRLEGELEAARAAQEMKDAAIEKLQESGRLHERRVVKELEGAHMSAAEELESLYEKRLQVEMERVKAMSAARDDIRYKGEEELRKLQASHEKEIQDLRASFDAQLAAMEARLAEAGDVRAEQDRFFSEYVKQAEEDFEDHGDRINQKLHKLTDAAEAREQKLKADNNILKRTNLRLKADKTIDMKRMDKLTTDNAALREQTEDLKLTIAKLTKELEERDAVNADNYVTIQQLRRKVQELEKHKYVLSYKAEAYSSKLEPQKEEIARLQDALDGHGRELLSQANRTQILTRHVAEKDAALRTVKTSLAAFKRRCDTQDAAITAFAQELYGAMQLPDDRTVHGKSARQKALDDLVRKYCLGDPRVSANRNAASEAIATAAAAETRVVLLQWRLDQEARTQRITNRITLNQNSQLLRELQVAQQDNRVLRDRIDAAVVALRELQHRHAMLERKVGLRSGRPGGTGPSGGVDGGGGGGGEEDYYLGDGGGDEEGEYESADGGGGSAVVSIAGRVPPSRPVSGAGPAAPTLPASPNGSAGRRTPVSFATNGHNGRHSHHSHVQSRPGTARPTSAGWGLTRVGGKTRGTVGGGGGSAGGGAVGVARGAPLKAFAELVVSERQRMESLAAQLESGAVAVGEQQRALLGLRDQLAAAAAAAAAADGEGQGDSDADGAAMDGLDGGDDDVGDHGLVGEGLGTPASFGRFSAVLEGAEEGMDGGGEYAGGGGGGGAAASTRATGGSSLGDVAEAAAARQQHGGGSGSSSRGVTQVSSGGVGGSTGGSPPSYHAPGLRGLALAGGGGSGSGGGAGNPNRFHASSGRPLTASLDASSRRSTASPSALVAAAGGRMRPGSSSASSSYGGVRGSAGSPSLSGPGFVAAGATPPASGGGGALAAGLGMGVPRSSSPTNGRRRPSSAGGVGLRAFTDDKVDRFRPPPLSSQRDLPF